MLDGGRGRNILIPLQIAIGEHVVPEWVCILSAKPMPPGITIAAKLSGARLQGQVASIGIERKIAAPQLEGLARPRGNNPRILAVIGMMSTVGAVNPIIESLAEAIHSQLLIPFVEALE